MCSVVMLPRIGSKEGPESISKNMAMEGKRKEKKRQIKSIRCLTFFNVSIFDIFHFQRADDDVNWRGNIESYP